MKSNDIRSVRIALVCCYNREYYRDTCQADFRLAKEFLILIDMVLYICRTRSYMTVISQFESAAVEGYYTVLLL